MGGCSCCGDAGDEEEEEVGEARSLKGPGFDRRCTDIVWLVIFVCYIILFGVVAWKVSVSSKVERLTHGTDYNGVICGDPNGKHNNLPQIYYPTLSEDMAKNPYKKFGICVNECPQQGTTIDDYAEGSHEPWYVPLPTFSLANRCVPYENTTKEKGTKMCAWPNCKHIPNGTIPTKPQEVCGIHLDNTADAWALEPPDTWLKMGWQVEGASKEIVDKRTEVLESITSETKDKCKVAVYRSISLTVDNKDAGTAEKLMAQYAGALTRQAEAFYDNRWIVIGLGLLGSFLLSILVIMGFSCMFQIIFPILVFLTFVTLIATEYIFFVQAGFATGKTGHKILNFMNSTGLVDQLGESAADSFMAETESILHAQDDQRMKQLFSCLAVALGIGIFVLFCVLLYIRRQFNLLVALLDEAARTICEMPSLLIYPFTNLLSIVFWTSILLWTMMGVMTLEPNESVTFFAKIGFKDLENAENLKNAQFKLMWMVVFSFLWIYFFHMAFFTATVATTVSRWYFYRQDAADNAGTGIHAQGWYFGRPVLHAMGNVGRYHLGSLALGSFVITLVTLPRLILEYIDRESKGAMDDNATYRCIMRCVKCCLWCLEQCIRMLTEYTYIYIGMRGQAFCRSAHKSCKLIVSYPVQVGLDQLASWILSGLSCTLVPTSMAVISFFVIHEGWSLCALVIFFLSFMVTRLCSGVYDICISTLFLCVMEDLEHHGGKYATGSLRVAMQLPAKSEEIELDEQSPKELDEQ